jgi:hypothetical protein
MPGHTKMIIYQNIDRIDLMIQQSVLPKIPRYHKNLRDQIDTALI